MKSLSIKNNQFFLNGEPFRILSGAIHYFRVVPEYWYDRLLKLKACGFNTVETYVPWNLHEPLPGQFNFSGIADIERFIEIASDLHLYVIVRPSPYICAEWEFGGLPAWLLADDQLQLRSFNASYIEKIEAYYDVLLAKLKPLQATHGGPIIAMQIENEYGSFGNDTAYLQFIEKAMKHRGIDVLLFTSDGPENHMLQGGMVSGVLATVNFGSRAKEAFTMLRHYQPEKPVMCMEFWNGWFDHWGEVHHVRDHQEVANELKTMLDDGGSVNFYMFHGGTNFGFMNGANSFSRHNYEPTITSYDYDAPLNEAGDPTEKYYAIRNILADYSKQPLIEVPPALPKRAYPSIIANHAATLFSQLDKLSLPINSVIPLSMEKYGQSYGYIVYETFISGPREENELILQDCHDRAHIFLDNQLLGIIERWKPDQKIRFSVPEDGATLKIMVENMGRINYGPYLRDKKGITEGVRHGNQFLYHWKVWTLSLDSLVGLQVQPISYPFLEQPSFYKANLNIKQQPADTYLLLEGWSKGVVFVNGFNIGRYWKIGPQQTLYIPAPLLREGDNEFIIFDSDGTMSLELNFFSTPLLG